MIRVGLYVFGDSHEYPKYYQIGLLFKELIKDDRFKCSIIIDGTSRCEKEVVNDYVGKVDIYDLRNHTVDELNNDFDKVIIIDPYGKPYYKYRLWKPNMIIAKCYGCIGVEKNYYSLLKRSFMRNSSIIIVENEFTKNCLLGIYGTKKRVIVGSPAFDYIYDDSYNSPRLKEYPKDKINILWSIHHSMIPYEYIMRIDGGLYSTFSTYFDKIKELSVRYRDSIVFHIKPHPYLRNSLKRAYGMTLEDLGNELRKYGVEVDSYNKYSYYQLFKNSDIILNDCLSFISEWLPQNKPMIVLTNESHPGYSEFGEYLINHCYYKSNSADELDSMISEIISDGIEKFDYQKVDRTNFIESMYITPGKSNSSQLVNMIYYMSIKDKESSSK